MHKGKWFFAVVAGLLSLGYGREARADLSAYIANVGFDKSVDLDRSMGFGLRWGKSSRILGGETSVLVARPIRKLENTTGGKETATAVFYEGRLMVSLPLKPVAPFANIGFGRILLTSTDAPTTQIPTDIGGLTPEQQERIAQANKALKAVSKLQQNTEFSYGVGARKSLGDRLDLRLDLRQYNVFSVKALVEQKLQEQAAAQVQDLTGIQLPVEKKKTVRYEEMSLGVSFRF